MNRAARREMERRFKAQGRDVVVLRGGPMDGWTVPSTAPALRPDWYTTWPPRVAAANQPGRYQLRPAEALAVWVEGS